MHTVVCKLYTRFNAPPRNTNCWSVRLHQKKGDVHALFCNDIYKRRKISALHGYESLFLGSKSPFITFLTKDLDSKDVGASYFHSPLGKGARSVLLLDHLQCELLWPLWGANTYIMCSDGSVQCKPNCWKYYDMLPILCDFCRLLNGFRKPRKGSRRM